MLTLSLANWMELPGLKLKDWIRDKRRSVRLSSCQMVTDSLQQIVCVDCV